MRRFVISDIHGCYKALKDVLNRVEFDYDNDELITLGDYFDGWSENVEVLDELMKIKKLIMIRGNHDEWFLTFIYDAMILEGTDDDHNIPLHLLKSYMSWKYHGGIKTINSYLSNRDKLDTHYNFLKCKSKLYHIDDDNTLFIHAGYKPNSKMFIPTKDEHKYYDEYMWDRTYVQHNVIYPLNNIQYRGDKNFNKVFIGHTPTIFFKDKDGNRYDDVIINHNIYMMDCGIAFDGRLSCINLDTDEIIYSEIGKYYYPDENGRM